MVRVKLEICGNVVFNGAFNRVHVFARCDAAAIAKAIDMRVHGLRGLGPPHVQHDIGRFAPDTGKRLKRRAGIGHNAVIVIHQNLAELDDVLGLVAIKPDGFDVIDHTVQPEVEHLLWRIGDLEQFSRGFVHAFVGRLRGQCHGDDQCIDVHMIEFAHRFGFARMKPRKDFPDRVIVELFGQFCHAPLLPVCARGDNPNRNIRVARPRARRYVHGMEQSDRYHYHVIRRALGEIDSADAPLSLDELAQRMDMSPAHFQRVFSRWVGVSSKRYQQYLRLDYAKTMLAENFTTLATADAVGLSGSGRLHDLFLKWEAMSPGDYAKGGAGLVIRWGCFESAFGPVIAMATDRGICGIGFTSEQSEEEAYADLALRWPHAAFTKDPDAIHSWVNAALSMEGETKLHMIGAPFQLKVWEALLSIPSGNVTTYGEIATAIGSPRAVRAVGTAVGRNPVGWLIPCHRALRKSGGLGGYHWGLPVKRAMLAFESAREDAW